ncbi:MAG: xanthine dehydrogenase family protein molybdopterin-binding subunit [Anaerolineales bacterium]|nr:xanthine dehydrogenase family protein molybdopterin-binding subunit [Anaerolineales bacterium]
MHVVGQSVRRYDAQDKVTGRAIYASDLSTPGMLHLKLVFAGRPHARLLGIDKSEALRSPGVKAVLTAQDVPCNRYGIMVHDRPVLCGDKVRHAGDQVAVVVAETPEQAAKAARLVRIEYEDLPVVDDPQQALLPGAVLVHEDHPGNIAHGYSMVNGDVDAALSRSDVVVSHEYHTPMQEHVFMEPEAGLGYIDEEGRVTLVTAGQDTHEDRVQIAEALDLPVEQVRVIYPAIGGSFGGREDLSMQTALALAAWKVRQPVKLSWSREESIVGHHKRHAFILRHTWGATQDGQLTAAKMEIISDSGAYCLSSRSVLDNLRFAATGPYQIPVVSLEAKTVYTNNVPAGAFRGFGFPQAAFAAEMQINYLAEALGIDPISMRLRNCFRDGSTFATRAPVPDGVSLTELIETCAHEMGAVKNNGGWRLPEAQASPDKRRAWGIAIGMKSSGFGLGYPEHSEARVELYGDTQIEQAVLYTAAADVGQGAHSALAQICAEALDLPIEEVRLVVSDTAVSGESGPASASRLTLFAGNAVKLAAEAARRDWRNENRPGVGDVRWDAPPTTTPDPVSGECLNSITISYAAQATEVEVDMDTGMASLKRVIAVHDPGQAVNPQQVVGQIEGGAIQAQGWALIENFITRGGHILTDRLSTYLIPTAVDIPDEFRTILIERPDAVGPYGVRGLGEIPFIPLAPAIVMAVHNAVGVWSDHLPVRAEWLLGELRKWEM